MPRRTDNELLGERPFEAMEDLTTNYLVNGLLNAMDDLSEEHVGNAPVCDAFMPIFCWKNEVSTSD